ncbi:GNAT family N-acetyltransferase (plasmid) [Phormidium sp. CLA17]|uniref:GNAT family N-acetyltransferase n=1 Tax=Leptolyngbya sp. Cla-17 TaxID=2803751 RepID=UPI0014921CE2|nr:GNAT family N-acetyltransferase [Leptolyngbya sp. Cla-17]MBM0744828.1 GNAT family N-acetyltransferase [Leptolyngbya sp. Cla-17]
MIRLSKPNDMAAILSIAEAIGFQPGELEVVNQLLTDYFIDGDGRDPLQNGNTQRFWLTHDQDNDGSIGVAYCEPERMTDQTWNLQLIAVHPAHQGQGHGGKLLRHVEETLKARGGRMLLVETLASFDLVQKFYVKYGYEEEARIRDFYAAGDDKVVFRKVLTVN